MKSKLAFALTFLLGFVLGVALLATDARAQEPAAASDAQKPAADKQDQNQAGPYKITSSIELGVRGIAINGNANKYRSDLNYTPGFRIFDSSLVMEAKEGEGFLFDKLMVSSFGWGIGGGDHRGNDPNRLLRVNAEKPGVYRFDVNYRRFDYFNSLTTLALNQHIANTEYRQGDFDLTILPNNQKFRLNLGYSLDRNTGPGVTTYDYQRDEYPVLAATRIAADDYRIGVDAKLWVFDISFLQGWRAYKEDTTYNIDVPNIGNNPLNTSVLNTFHRDLPTRGTSPYTRFSLHTFLKKRLDFTGRYIYSSGNTKYTLFERATGKDSSGNNITLDTFQISGNAKRPHGMGDLATTVFISDNFRVSETFRVDSFRISGGQELFDTLNRTRSTGVPLPVTLLDQFNFRTTNYRRYLNLIEGDYEINRRLSVHAGYRFTDRHIELGSNDFNKGAAPAPELEKFDNQTNSFIFGFKAKPVRIWSLYFDLERGGSDNVFTRVANYDFTNVRVRSILRPTKNLTINASLTTRNNNNPSVTEDVPPRNFGADIKTRIFSTSADWTPSEKFSVGGGYTYAHVVSEATIVFFNAGIRTDGVSRYFSKDSFAFLNAYWQILPRLGFYGGYRIHNDPGQGDRLPTPTVFIGSFPYQFQSPEAKFVVKLSNRIDWIAGYQYWDYQESFPNLQRYEAHLPYTSVRFHFGRRQ
ncbi:MAG TPA: hypothetical protein VNS63_12895 [Blastocatellia bacterium]|nr:hypothetical protein [Blastocatellia bacterium]